MAAQSQSSTRNSPKLRAITPEPSAADLSHLFDAPMEAVLLGTVLSDGLEEAAKVAGVTPRTLYRWQKEPEFDAAYRAAKRTAFGQAIARLHHLSSAAVSILGKVMMDPATPAATKVRAADSILARTAKAIETEEIEGRLAALEEAAQKPDGRR